MAWRSIWRLTIALLLLPAISLGQSSWEDKNRSGEKAFQEGRLLEASRLFNEALRDAEQFGPNDVRLAPIYNNLALVSFVQNNFIASETLYEKSIAVMQAQGQQNPLLLPVLDNLTSLYVKQWAFANAIRTSWRACQIREKKFGPASLELATGMNKLANLYLDNVRLLPQSSAEKSAQPDFTGTNSTAKTSGCELQGFSLSIENAAALDDPTKLAIAEALFDRVLDIQEKAYGNENTRLVDVLQNLGEVRHAEGKGAAAEAAYARTITIVEKSFGPDDLKLALPLQQLAALKTDDGNYADAEKLYQRALQIDQSKMGTNDPSLEPVLTGYAAVLENMHRSEEAKVFRDRANAIVAPQTLKNVASSPSSSVPYILRFEKSVYDQYTGFQQTCTLVRADGRLRVEEQQQERTGPAIAQEMPHPDNVPSGAKPQDTFSDRSGGSHAPKVFESSVDNNSLQQLQAILSAKEIRDLQGSYSPHKEANSPNTEKLSASILRDDGVQNFMFPDTSTLRPYEGGLKPLFRWVNTAEKHKGTAIKGAVANNCSPDSPKAVPLQFSSSRKSPLHNADTSTVGTPNRPTSDIGQDKISTLKVNVNLVLVRAVVRDSQGRALGTLKEEDFRLLDNGKPQTITKFSREQPGTDAKAPDGTTGMVGSESAKKAASVERSVAYLFDDIHLNASDLKQVRNAADRHLSSLQPAVRAAIFTTSGQTTLDFTDDHTKLHDTLLRIQPRQVGSAAGNDCPDIDPYLADLIANKHDEDALGAATQDAWVCAYASNIKFVAAAETMAKATAQQQLAAAETQGRIALGAFQNALHHLAAMPGQHTLILISPGFVVPGHEQDLGQLIEQALHSDIIISTLDARGLYHIDSVAQSNNASLQYRRESAAANEEVLTNLANATGGTSFHNSNDFASGFNRVAEAPEYYYVLGFSPQEQEMDGRFHNLTVAVNSGEKATVQARKGYYARKQ
ncbi:MAG TPA: VWA domain-containing protein [Candidatus Sulfotelmatobacter sp.]|jgi:VWFA-related protein|nr:VWA domain-containing protein [Candidatus Sulfotelmatobacter sp.]